jgi:hypothetical protein
MALGLKAYEAGHLGRGLTDIMSCLRLAFRWRRTTRGEPCSVAIGAASWFQA